MAGTGKAGGSGQAKGGGVHRPGAAHRGLARKVVADLGSFANPQRREKAKSYVPSSLEVLGVAAPDMRRVARPVARSLKGSPPEEVLTTAWALRETGVLEVRQIAFELVGGRPDVVAGLDGATVEAFGQGNDNWASVDCFGVNVAGPAWRDGGVRDADVARWCGSPDRWWRRTALVATVALNMKSRGGRGDPGRTLAVCARLAADTEPMVAKGHSWALRALVGVDREAVEEFLAEHHDVLPALVRREVGNKLRTGRKSGR